MVCEDAPLTLMSSSFSTLEAIMNAAKIKSTSAAEAIFPGPDTAAVDSCSEHESTNSLGSQSVEEELYPVASMLINVSAISRALKYVLLAPLHLFMSQRTDETLHGVGVAIGQ